MIRPGPGVAFTWTGDGDQRRDSAARSAVISSSDVPEAWATVHQVHGSEVVAVDEPGPAGDADALVVTEPGLACVVFTADCLGIVLRSEGATGVVHAGWRGLAAGVIERTQSVMEGLAGPPTRAYVGPGIGPCCFEVGPEVAERFAGHTSMTTWGTVSVDLASASEARLQGLPVWRDRRCTMCGGGLSHRRTGEPARMAAIGWVA